MLIRCEAQKPAGRPTSAKDKGFAGLGDVLGPIGLTVGKVDTKVKAGIPTMPLCPQHVHQVADAQAATTQQDAPSAGPNIERLVESAGVSMGPIALTFGSNTRNAGDASTSGAMVKEMCFMISIPYLKNDSTIWYTAEHCKHVN